MLTRRQSEPTIHLASPESTHSVSSVVRPHTEQPHPLSRVFATPFGKSPGYYLRGFCVSCYYLVDNNRLQTKLKMSLV